ncbi:MAG: DUF3179 domain-containing (seleno)protein [Isosphaeraceae bacterium]
MTPEIASSRQEQEPGPSPSQSAGAGLLGKPLPRGVGALVLLVLIGLVFFEVRMLWTEWNAMRQDLERAGEAAPIGFHNVYAHPTRAARPKDWFRAEGNVLYLWAGWEGNQHRWFKASRSDLERRRLSIPISRDVIRSVNDPWVEVGGGSIWERMPPQAMVVGESLAGIPTAYPMRLLRIMNVVNDLVEGHPYLALLSHSHPPNQPVTIYDAQVHGERITLGTSGYLLDGRTVLYDHETESLWIEDSDSLLGLSGSRKGIHLPFVARPSLISWSAWKDRNPRTRLLVGTHEETALPPRAALTGNTPDQRASL